MHTIYLLTGSNQGNRSGWLDLARKYLEEKAGPIVVQSGIYQTAAWGKTDQPDFLNQVLCIDTELTPIQLLASIHILENQAGRERIEKWGPRTLDVDILFYDDEIVNLPELTIPHPALAERRFTLVPLAEIAPKKVHPILKQSMYELLAQCPDLLTTVLYRN